MTNGDKASITLRRAADLIELKGLTKGRFHDNGSFCFLGAVHQVLWGNPFGTLGVIPTEWIPAEMWPVVNEYRCYAREAERRVSRLLRESGQMLPGQYVSNWNDKASTTQADVVEVMRRAAEL
jgi:hypothetical protein